MKVVNSCYYVHKNYADSLPVKVKLDIDFEYTIIKYNKVSKVVTYISCPGFDTEQEPVLGDCFLVYPDGKTKLIPGCKDNPFIYHHKWMFVGEDYKGFDVDASKQRSNRIESWKVDKKRIGRKRYWDKVILKKKRGSYA